MKLPHCPYQSCAIGRNPLAEHRTREVTRESADRMAIPTGAVSVFRCGYCDGVWAEPEASGVQPLGKLTNSSGGFKLWDDPSKVVLSRNGDQRVAAAISRT